MMDRQTWRKQRVRLGWALFLAFAILGLKSEMLLAQSADAIFDEGLEIAERTRAAFDEIWAQSLIDFFDIPKDLAEVFALVAVCFLVMDLVRQSRLYEQVDWSVLIWPLIVAFVLNTPGVAYGQALAVRSLINEVNDAAIFAANIERSSARNQGNIAIRSVIGQAQDRCGKLPTLEQRDCLIEERRNIEAAINAQANRNDGDWLQSWLNTVQGFFAAVDAVDQNGARPDEALAHVIWLSAAPIWEQIFLSVLNSIQGSFQYGIEIALLITALLQPFAWALSITPVGGKAIYGWAISMFSVGVLQLSYTLCAGLALQIIASSEVSDSSLPLGFFLALVAPFLSFSLAAGGGVLVWQNLANLGTTANALATRFSAGR